MPDRKPTQQSYNRLSSWYDYFSGSEDRVSQQALERLQPQAGECILEIGFGTGRSLRTLTERVGAQGIAAGLDVSPGMARVTRTRLEQANLTQRAMLSLGDAVYLPYPASRFDGVFCAFTLELFSSKEIPVVLAECWRVLRPEGRIAVVSLYQPVTPGRMVQIYEWFHRQMPNLVDCRPIPVQQMIAAAGYTVSVADIQAIWGLPVQVVVAEKPSPSALPPGDQLPAVGS